MKKIVLATLLLLITTSVVVAISTRNSTIKVKTDDHIVAQLDSINILVNNAGRQVTEYDADNESADPLLWSREKTEQEIMRLFQAILKERRHLKVRANLNDVAYQGRVRQWSIRIPEEQNGYRSILEVLWQVAQYFPEARSFFECEVDEALRIKSYEDALWAVDRIAANSDDKATVYQKYLPYFEGTVESAMIQFYLLMKDYEEASALKAKLTDTTAETWIDKTNQLDSRLDTLRSVLTGTSYEDQVNSSVRSHLGSLYAPIFHAEKQDLMSREVKIHLSGVVYGEWQILCEETVIRNVSCPSKQYIREEMVYKLPGIGFYQIQLKSAEKDASPERVVTFDTGYLAADVEKVNDLYYVVASSKADGHPMSGVEVQILKHFESTVLGVVKTDETGTVALDPQPRPGEVLRVVVADPALSRPVEHYVSKPKPEPSVELMARTSTEFYPDRSIYKRGQEVKMGLVLQKTKGAERKLLTNHKGVAKLYAFRQQDEELVSEQSYVTDRHGVCEVRFMLPDDPALSNYQVRTDTDDRYYLTVEDYKLNYLNVKVDSIPTGQTTGYPMKVYGHVEDMNGFPVWAKLELTYDGESKLAVESNEKGQFLFETKEISSRSSWRSRHIFLRATDPLGNVVEERIYLSKDSVSLPLNAALLNGVYEKSAVALSLDTQPFNRTLLGDLERYCVVATLIAPDGDEVELGPIPMSGVQTFNLQYLKSGRYGLRLETTDYFGQKVLSQSDKAIYLYDMADEVFYEEENPLFVHSGDQYTLLASSYPVTVKLIKRLRDGSKSIVFRPLDPKVLYRLERDPLVSSLSVSTYYQGDWCGNDKEFTTYTEFEDKLRIVDAGDKVGKTFAPGQRYAREFIVLNENNEPCKDVPLIVTVYDVTLNEAAGELEWPDLVYSIPDVDLIEYPTLALETNSLRVSDMQMAKSLGSSNAVEDAVVRKNFVENAYFSALLKSDQEGRVKLSFDLPDTQTSFVLLGYAFTPDLERDGTLRDSLSVFAPTSIELSLPRYLRYHDTLSGSARIANQTDETVSAQYRIVAADQVLAEGKVSVAPRSHQLVPFLFVPDEELGEQVVITASLSSGDSVLDRVERTLPLLSDSEEYVVAVPFNSYKADSVTIGLPKLNHAVDNPSIVVYFSPQNLLFSELAKEYRTIQDEEIRDIGLFEATSQYAVLAQLRHFLEIHPEIRHQLQAAIPDLEAIDHGEKSKFWDRQASPKELANFYGFVTSEKRMAKRMEALDKYICGFAVPTGGFRFNSMAYEASPWLTHSVLSQLAKYARHYTSPELKKITEASITFLKQKIGAPDSYYNDYVALAMLLSAYDTQLDNLTDRQKEQYDRQVVSLRKHYQTADPSQLIRYARYAHRFESSEQWQSVVSFIEERLAYTRSDMERMVLELFLSDVHEVVGPETIRFLLQMKQGTIWSSPFILDAVELILQNTGKTSYAPGASLRVNERSHLLTPEERATGQVFLPVVSDSDSLHLSWIGITSDVFFGGITYRVREKAQEVVPTGEKLKIQKEVFARRVSSEGAELVRLTPNNPARQGEKLVVRYFLETAQDLSLVMIADTRIGGAEPGYDFSGYGLSDRLFWLYSRRETSDVIFIDYLPRGKHVLQMEAVANVGGAYAYGPANIQSIYAPEYAGNSAGGTVVIKQK